jgi:hypothetical protein
MSSEDEFCRLSNHRTRQCAKVINKEHIQQDVTAHACSTPMARARLASDFHVS